MQSEKLFLRINPKRIWYLKFILEGYDGIAVLSTEDRQSGLVLLRFGPEERGSLISLLAHIAPLLRNEPPVSGDI